MDAGISNAPPRGDEGKSFTDSFRCWCQSTLAYPFKILGLSYLALKCAIWTSTDSTNSPTDSTGIHDRDQASYGQDKS